MKLALANDKIYIQASKQEYPIVKGLPNARFDKKTMAWIIPNTLEMLDRIQRLVKLPEKMECERQRLRVKQELIDRERLTAEPKPLRKYPVKVSLFQHQVRGANMALYAFDLEGVQQK